MTDTPNHKRRFQFSLRTLLLSVLLASIPLGWLAMELQRTREQRQATEELISQSIRTADRIVITVCGDGKSSQIAVFDDKSQFPRLADSVRVRSVDAYLGPASCRFMVEVSVGDDKGFAFLGASVDTILLDENLDFVRSGQPYDYYARLYYARLDEALGREIERMVGRTFLQMWEGTSNSAIDTIGGGESFTLHD